MDFKVWKHSSVLLLGKPRAFSMEEFLRQMRQHDIGIVSIADSRKRLSGVAAVIEGERLDPLEQDLLEQLYFENEMPIVRIDTLEEILAGHMNVTTLLMSLKLSKDARRLHGFLTNALMDDTLFIKLLKLYDFQGKGFFDTDENRDVTTALIERFYDNLEQNHNIQYISMGVVELINKSSNAALIHTMATLSMVPRALRDGGDALMEAVLFALAQHPSLQQPQQLQFAQSDHKALCTMLAQRDDLDGAVESILLLSRHDAVKEALASNARLSEAGMECLLAAGYEQQIVLHVNVTDARFKTLMPRHPELLARNPTLSADMFATLLARHEHHIDRALAENRQLLPAIAQALYRRNDTQVLHALARNPAVERCLLEHLFEQKFLHASLASNPHVSQQMIAQLRAEANSDVLEALAANEATPLELLYEFLLDMRLENIVRQNSALNTKYQR